MLIGLRENCAMKLMVLGLAGQVLDPIVAEQLCLLVSSLKHLKILDISKMRLMNFDNFVEVLEAIQRDNKSLQYLNIGGLVFHIQNESNPVPAKAPQPPPKTSDGIPKEPEPPVDKSLLMLTKIITNHTSKLTHLNLSGCFPGMQAMKEE